MKNIILLCVLLASIAMKAQEKQKIRIAEIEVFPEFLEEYLLKAKNVGAISVEKEKGVICIFPMQMKENPTQIRIIEIYASEKDYEFHIKTPHFLEYKTTTLQMIKSLKLIEMEALNPDKMIDVFKKLNQ